MHGNLQVSAQLMNSSLVERDILLCDDINAGVALDFEMRDGTWLDCASRGVMRTGSHAGDSPGPGGDEREG